MLFKPVFAICLKMNTNNFEALTVFSFGDTDFSQGTPSNPTFTAVQLQDKRVIHVRRPQNYMYVSICVLGLSSLTFNLCPPHYFNPFTKTTNYIHRD